MPVQLPSDEELLRKVMFVPCKTKEALHRWIKTYLGLDMPDGRVDNESTSSPMEVIWETYHAAMTNRKDFNYILAYSSRDSFKTLGAAVLEVLMIMHMNRSVAHMAAIKPQSQKSQQYVKKFFNRPFLREYVSMQNETKVEVTRYQHRKTKINIPAVDWYRLPSNERDQYDEFKFYIVIVVCTLQGANSEHVPFMVVDEVDVVENPEAYEEAKMIPTVQGGSLPITFLTSTRKFSYGLVQKEIDNAHDTELAIRHWNIVDVTERCHPERHLPQEPRIVIYRSNDNLKSISEKEWLSLNQEQQRLYVRDEGYTGCLRNCRLFAMCKGRLADLKDRPYSSPEYRTDDRVMLKPIDHVIKQFKKVSVEKAKAQLLCWKPSTEGLIYPRLDRDVHMLTAAQMAERISGEKILDHENYTKNDLIELMKSRHISFQSGMDFGYSHNFAVVTAAIDGMNAYVIDVIAENELELAQQIDVCTRRISRLNPAIWPDVASPQLIASFKTSGFRMKDWSKQKDSVAGGIEIVRMKLNPSVGAPQLFFLKNDAGCEFLIKQMGQYHWTTDAAGTITGEPDDSEDDECDALRYLIMNVYRAKGKTAIPDPEPSQPQQKPGVYTQDNWMRQVIAEQIGVPVSEHDIAFSNPSARGRKGSLVWDVG